ncbi:hypothetical protein GCM10008012_46790 [Rhizobium anhuiense]|nr:hypothetical protein GCM10008012_46790 [Rhizobium anhuiense]
MRRNIYSSHQIEVSADRWLLADETLGKGLNMNFSRSFNNWRKYRQTVTELGRMTNRELHDLGIDRSDIHRVAREASAR